MSDTRLLAQDLLDACVGDPRSGSDRTLGVLRDGFADSGTPLLLSAGAAYGGPSEAGKAVGHLPGGFDRCAKGSDGLRRARIVKAGRDSESLGLGAKAVIRLRLTDAFAVGHMARILATLMDVKG